MNRPDDLDWTLLDRYVARDATADEAAQVESWLGRDPSHRALFEGYALAHGGCVANSQWLADDAPPRACR